MDDDTDDVFDEHGRIRPGVLPGWGLSWWLAEQGVTRERYQDELSPSERLRLVNAYWQAEGAGWTPSVPREEWQGPHHPSDPAPDEEVISTLNDRTSADKNSEPPRTKDRRPE